MDSKIAKKLLYSDAQNNLYEYARRKDPEESQSSRIIHFALIDRNRNTPELDLTIVKKGEIVVGVVKNTLWSGWVEMEVNEDSLHSSRYLIKQTKILLNKLTDRTMMRYWEEYHS